MPAVTKRSAAACRPCPKRSRGRPCGGSDAIIRAVLDATLEELGLRGFGALSVEEVARRAGVNKTTVYRRWPTKTELVGAALEHFREDEALLPDSGTLRKDVLALLGRMARAVSAPRGRSIARALLADNDAELRELTEWLWERHNVAPSRVIFERAIARGELPAATDTVLLLELFSAPIFHRVLMTRRPVDDAFLARVVDVVLHGALDPASRPPRARAGGRTGGGRNR